MPVKLSSYGSFWGLLTDIPPARPISSQSRPGPPDRSLWGSRLAFSLPIPAHLLPVPAPTHSSGPGFRSQMGTGSGPLVPVPLSSRDPRPGSPSPNWKSGTPDLGKGGGGWWPDLGGDVGDPGPRPNLGVGGDGDWGRYAGCVRGRDSGRKGLGNLTESRTQASRDAGTRNGLTGGGTQAGRVRMTWAG